MTMLISTFVLKIRACGGEAYVAGGCVRDTFLRRPCHDHDIMVTGLDVEKFEELFPEAVKTGKGFPVYRLDLIIDGVEERQVEVALARKERKVGTGHNGFEVFFDKSVTLEEDLIRRDTTMNAMVVRLWDDKLIDLFGGQEDIRKKVIRAVSEHFTDDPIRALRAARQAAQFGFTIETGTRSMMHGMLGEIQAEPKERIVGEFVKALGASRPSVFFRELRAAGLLGGLALSYLLFHGYSHPTGYFDRATNSYMVTSQKPERERNRIYSNASHYVPSTSKTTESAETATTATKPTNNTAVTSKGGFGGAGARSAAS